MGCDAKIRPFPGDLEVQCERDHTDTKHEGTIRDYAYPGSATVLSWFEDDRRTFRGTWSPCLGYCTLPHGHHGNHAP